MRDLAEMTTQEAVAAFGLLDVRTRGLSLAKPWFWMSARQMRDTWRGYAVPAA